MNLTTEQIAFYDKLKTQLEETTSFPNVYLYKFILPNNPQKKTQLEEIIRIAQEKPTKITSKLSSSGKYESFSIEMWVSSASKVIDIYQKVGEIEGIVSL